MPLLAVSAMVATALWSLCLAGSPDVLETLRCSFIAAGAWAALSFAAIDYRPGAGADSGAAWRVAVILPLYQVLMALALRDNIVVAQAFINCNGIIILAYVKYVAGGDVATDVAGAACIMAAAAVYIAHRAHGAPPALPPPL
jgi:hypothetical protein